MTAPAIAVGHAVAVPTPLFQLSGSLFARYEKDVPNDFRQDSEIDGSLARVNVGLPTIFWRLILSQSEFDWLKSNVFTADMALLTIRSRNYAKAARPWERFSVYGYWVDLGSGSDALLIAGGFWQVELVFRHCVSLGV